VERNLPPAETRTHPHPPLAEPARGRHVLSAGTQSPAGPHRHPRRRPGRFRAAARVRRCEPARHPRRRRVGAAPHDDGLARDVARREARAHRRRVAVHVDHAARAGERRGVGVGRHGADGAGRHAHMVPPPRVLRGADVAGTPGARDVCRPGARPAREPDIRRPHPRGRVRAGGAVGPGVAAPDDTVPRAHRDARGTDRHARPLEDRADRPGPGHRRRRRRHANDRAVVGRVLESQLDPGRG